jgi:hypothetical protein
MRGLSVISGWETTNLLMFFYTCDYLPKYDRKSMILFCLPIYASIVIANYFILMKKNKDKEIMKFYKAKYSLQKHNPFSIALIISYCVFSIGYPFYVMFNK